MNCGDRDCDNRPCATPAPTEHPYVFICPAPNGYFADPDNCRKFYICQDNFPVSNLCDTSE